MNIVLKRTTYKFALQLKKAVPRRLIDRQLPRPKIFTKEDLQTTFNPLQALQLIKCHTFSSFTQTVEVCIQLGVNPKNGQQLVRGSAPMPAGLGKTTKVAVLCQQSQKEQLSALGVDLFIGKQQLQKISSGITQFQMLFTTPQLLPKLKPLGKILGPRQLMPNPKVGTLIGQKDLSSAIVRAKAGQVNFRVDSGRNIHAQIGKITFTDEQLLINFKSLMNSLQQKRPIGLKGKYFLGAYIKSTMGPRWKLNLDDIDPKGSKNIWGLIE